MRSPAPDRSAVHRIRLVHQQCPHSSSANCGESRLKIVDPATNVTTEYSPTWIRHAMLGQWPSYRISCDAVTKLPVGPGSVTRPTAQSRELADHEDDRARLNSTSAAMPEVVDVVEEDVRC